MDPSPIQNGSLAATLSQFRPAAGQWRMSPAVEVRNVTHRDIYTPPQEPGWVAWARVWKEQDGAVRVYFSEATGDPYQLPVKESRQSARTGVHEIISTDNGRTWQDRGWLPALDGSVPPGRKLIGRRINPIFIRQLADGRRLATFLAVDPTRTLCSRDFTTYDKRWLTWNPPAPAGLADLMHEQQHVPISVSYICQSRDGRTWQPLFGLDGPAYAGVGRLVSILQLRDGTILCAGGRSAQGLPHPAPHDASVLIESVDGGKTWSEPITVYPTDGRAAGDLNLSAENAMVELSQGGHVLLLQRRNSPGGRLMLELVRTGPGRWESREMPQPFRGIRQPNLLRCTDGAIWNWDPDGHHYVSVDDGRTWQAHRIAPTYYGHMVQTDDGAILSITQANIADRPFPHVHDATIRMTRFEYDRIDVLAQHDAGADFALATQGSDDGPRDFHARLLARVDGFSALAFRVRGADDYCFLAVRILPEEAPHGLVADGPCPRRRATLLLGRMRHGRCEFLVQREAYGGLAPGTWVQMQLRTEGEKLMGALLEGPGRAPFYVLARDDRPAGGGLGFLTHQATGAFKDLTIWPGPREIRGNWKETPAPLRLPEAGPGDGLEGRRKSPFWF